jgi:uncharacterized membrane protein YhfC
METFYSVPTLSIAFMCVSAIVSIGLPIALFLILRKRFKLKAVPMFIGAAAFVVFALVLEQILHFVVLHSSADGTIALRSKPLLYTLYGCFAAGIFEETGRFVSFKLLRKKYRGETAVSTGLSYGIGHGGIEAILLSGVSMLSSAVISILLNAHVGGIAALLPAVSINALVDTAPYMFLIAGVERIGAVAVHIALSLIVWKAVTVRGAMWLYPLAIVLHAAVDVLPVLMQLDIIRSVALVEGLLYVFAAALFAVARLVYKKLPDKMYAPHS